MVRSTGVTSQGILISKEVSTDVAASTRAFTGVDRSRPRFYFSLRSPYSWLAWHDLERRHNGLLKQMQWIPFWEPDEATETLLLADGASFPYTPMSRPKHMYVLQDVRRLAGDRGLNVSWPVDNAPWWEPSHLAYLAALHQGAGMQWVDRIYRARWQEGLDICDREVIRDLASDVCPEPDRLADAIDDPSLRQAGARALLSACHERIFGVPYFLHRFERFWGLDRLDRFVASLSAVSPEPELAVNEKTMEAISDTSRATDWGHAGGCG